MAPSEYESALALIGEIEGASKKTDVSFINISDLVNKEVASKVKYSDILQLISEVEGGGRKLKERPLQSVQTAMPAQPVQPVPGAKQATSTITSQIQAPPLQEEKVAKPGGRFGFGLPRARLAPKEAETQRRLGAAAELSSIVGRLQQPKQAPLFPEIKLKKKVNMKELVLPNLSIADQISELERIIEGLRENVFDLEQTGIVIQEIYGTEQMVIEERKKLKGKPPSENELEKSLYDIRDQRLTEAATLLQQMQRQGAK
jgi:hypothetical protein